MGRIILGTSKNSFIEQEAGTDTRLERMSPCGCNTEVARECGIREAYTGRLGFNMWGSTTALKYFFSIFRRSRKNLQYFKYRIKIFLLELLKDPTDSNV